MADLFLASDNLAPDATREAVEILAAGLELDEDDADGVVVSLATKKRIS
ncbi:MAG: hypothetical protein P9M14_04875 [Candidatus Alcyoniella australis]|nr:hypothetical protein [Candidatus Alcyoniella australis]